MVSLSYFLQYLRLRILKEDDVCVWNKIVVNFEFYYPAEYISKHL